MQIFKKEKKVVALALEHADVAAQCLDIMVPALKGVTTGQLDELAENADRVNHLETRADGLLREMRDLLYSGAYLPTVRGDLYRLLSKVDKIANRAEGCLNFVSCQRPSNLGPYAGDFAEILDMTVDCFAQLRDAMRAFLSPQGEVDEFRARTRKVRDIETRIDEIERSVTIKLFRTDLALAEKQHVAELLSRVVRISDQIENTADELELLSLKSII
jgi:predicted phosphate transport protein (TIGR00153 family)